jgi:hypothetical protein
MRMRRLLAWTGAALLLGVVFAAYLNPHLMVELSNLAWSCF